MKPPAGLRESEGPRCSIIWKARLDDECGVFAVYSRDEDVVADTYCDGLYALQHRGQESCGIPL